MIVKDEIVLNEDSHTYWDARTGRRVVGLTEMLKALGYFSGFSSDDALRRGRNVHLAIHYHLKGRLKIGPGIDPASLSPLIRPYFDSFIQFEALMKFEPMMSEQKLYDPAAHLSCTMDAAGTLNGQPGVFDWKSGAVLNWVRYQTASFINAMPKRAPGTPRLKRWGLELRPDGKPARLTLFDDPTDMAKVRQHASTFYTFVNDGVLKWPQTRTAFDQIRRQNDGLELFGWNGNDGTCADNNDEAGNENVRIGKGAFISSSI
jgi:hypothetical protein